MLLEMMSVILAALAAGYLGIKLCCPWLLLDIHYISKVIPSLRGFKNACKKKHFIIDHFEDSVKCLPDHNFLLYQDQSFTYKEANKQAYTVARTLLSLGLKTGDTIALLQYNEPEFIWTILGCLKVGIRVSLINTNLRGKALVHCLNVSDTNIIVTGNDDELISAVDSILCDLTNAVVYVQGTANNKLPSGFTSLHCNQNEADLEDIDFISRSEQTESDPAIFVFTSGTTGLPKAATVSHKRMLAPYIVSGILGLRRDDTVYVPLPLYHSNGLLVGVCSAICHGSSIALAKKFSRSNFWRDVQQHKATVFTYIGEMCRYLLTNKQTDKDKDHSIRLAIGNGLRQDIFAKFKNRFGIPNIAEFYASTEGVAGFANVSNVIGSCGRSSPFLQKVVPCGLFQWDVENQCLSRDDQGHCIPVKIGQPGLLLMQINTDQPYDGYKGQQHQSESKIIRNVRKNGDIYFNTGDLMTNDKDYNIYFNDRIGDTFRWKSENVSTTEVSNLLTDVDFIIDACVYGVPIPGYDGNAGMATLLIKPEVTEITDKELYVISLHCQQVLPAYAIPMFLRMKWGELDMTGTIKQSKLKLKEEGFDYGTIGDPLFYYEKSTKTFKNLNIEDIRNHTIKF